jgi:hypothetical protein
MEVGPKGRGLYSCQDTVVVAGEQYLPVLYES